MHNHIVKAVAFPHQQSPSCVATGGQEKKLRIFDLTQTSASSPTTATTTLNGSPSSSTMTQAAPSPTGFELGPGVHTASIKSVVWLHDYNIIVTAAEDKTLRWWDLRSRAPCATVETDMPISSCELNALEPTASPLAPRGRGGGSTGGDAGLLAVAAGKTCYFFDGARPGELVKKVAFDHEVASVAVNVDSARFVTGGKADTWVRVWDWETDRELGEAPPPSASTSSLASSFVATPTPFLLLSFVRRLIQ